MDILEDMRINRDLRKSNTEEYQELIKKVDTETLEKMLYSLDTFIGNEYKKIMFLNDEIKKVKESILHLNEQKDLINIELNERELTKTKKEL